MFYLWKRLLIVFAFILYFFTILWLNRVSFLKKFDAVYWQNRYDQSQWRLPTSKRILGDSGLYEIEGYHIFKGEDPSLFNPEVPPLGKYLIGFFITYFGSASYYGLFVFLLSFIALFSFLFLLTASFTLSAAATFLVFTDPLIIMQFSAPMIDMLQLFFILLCGVLLMGLYKLRRSTWDYVISLFLGMSMGFFSLTKFPLLIIPLLLEVFILLRNVWKGIQKKILFVALCVLGCIFSYGLVYFRYFAIGHTCTDWLGLQKWMVNFFWESKLHANIGSIMTTLLINIHQDLFTKSWVHPEVWSLSWPALTICFFVSLLLFFFKKGNRTYPPYLLFSFCTILVYVFVPFWTRYLVVILPLFSISMVVLLRTFLKVKHSVFIVLILCICNVFVSIQLLIPKPHGFIAQFATDWKYGFFQDMYERIDPASLQNISREEFHRTGQKFWYDGQIEEANVRINNISWNFLKKEAKANLEITYKTRSLGFFAEKTEIPLRLRDNQWYVVWDWNNFIQGLSDNATIETTVKHGKRGSIYKGDELIAGDIPSFLISVIPNKIHVSREEEFLNLIQDVFDKRLIKPALHYRYVGNTQPDWPIPIGVIPVPLDNEDIRVRIQQLRNFPGVYFENAVSRYPSLLNKDVINGLFEECCSLLYSPTSYYGVSGYEKQFDRVISGSDGGMLLIRNSSGTIVRIIKNILLQNGNDVYINSTE